MKISILCVLIIFLINLLGVSQSNPIFRIGIPYKGIDFSELKSYQQSFKQVVSDNYFVEPVIVENFEKRNAFFINLSIGYLWDDPFSYLEYSYISSGGRTDYGDYSGMIRQDLIITIQKISVGYSPIIYNYENFVNIKGDFSLYQTFYKLNENYQLKLFDSNSSEKNKITRESYGLSFKIANEIYYSYAIFGINGGINMGFPVYYDNRKTDFFKLDVNPEFNLYFGVQMP